MFYSSKIQPDGTLDRYEKLVQKDEVVNETKSVENVF